VETLMYLFDTFHNFLSGLGVQGRDKSTAFQYVKPIWSRQQLEASFQSDWIARKAISIPAQDATREWRAWQAKGSQIEDLEATEKRLQVQLKLQQALTKARLYGGCCILIGVDGNMAKELDPETIAKDGLKYLHVLAPHQLVVEKLVHDLESPYYGQPEYYELRGIDTVKTVRIHPSRMVRLTGLDQPDPMENAGWGDPVMQVIHDSVSAAGTVMASVAVLIQEAKLDVIKIPGLTEIFSTTEGTSRMVKRFTEANVAKSVVNGILLDGEEEWQRIGVDFTGMPEVLQMYLQIAAGAADIPVTRFLGQAPAGLNSTGESDLTNYYDRIASDQELRLSPALEKLDKAIVRSALGRSDDNIFYNWNSLWQIDDSAKADIAKKKAEVVKIDVDCGLMPFVALAKGRANQLIEDGTYPGFEAALEEELAKQDFAEREEEAVAAEEEAARQQAEIAKANAGNGDEPPAKTNGKEPPKEKVPAP
jgi:phage-related protein (TIGR01555 family)